MDKLISEIVEVDTGRSERIHIIRYHKYGVGYEIEFDGKVVGFVKKIGPFFWESSGGDKAGTGRRRCSATSQLLHRLFPDWKGTAP